MRPIMRLNQAFHYLSSLLLLALVFLTVGDVAGRYFFNRPITGTYELTGLLTAAAVFLAFGYAHVRGEHVTIDLLHSSLPARHQRLLDAFATLVTIGALLLLAWGLYEYAGRMERGGYTTSVLAIPVGPFVWVCVGGTIGYTLAACADLMSHLRRGPRRQQRS